MEVCSQHHAPAALHPGKNLKVGSTAGFEKSKCLAVTRIGNPERSARSQYVGKIQNFLNFNAGGA